MEFIFYTVNAFMVGKNVPKNNIDFPRKRLSQTDSLGCSGLNQTLTSTHFPLVNVCNQYPHIRYKSQFVDMVLSMNKQPQFRQHLPHLLRINTSQKACLYLTNLIIAHKKEKHIRFIISNGELCGLMDYTTKTIGGQKYAFIGYYKNPLCTKKGVITSGLIQLSNSLFESGTIPRLSIYGDNIKSIAVAHNAGFREMQGSPFGFITFEKVHQPNVEGTDAILENQKDLR